MKSDRKASRLQKKADKKASAGKKPKGEKGAKKKGKKAEDSNGSKSNGSKSKKQKPATQATDEDIQATKKPRIAKAKKTSQDAPVDKVDEHGMNDENDVGDSKVSSGSPSKSPVKVRNRGLKKLRKMVGCKPCHVHEEFEEDGPTESDEIQKGLGGGEQDPDGDCGSQEKSKPKAKSTKTNFPVQDKKKSKSTKDKQTAEPKEPKKRRSAKTGDQQQSQETSKQTKPRKKSGSSSKKQPVVPDDSINSLIKSTLE